MEKNSICADCIRSDECYWSDSKGAFSECMMKIPADYTNCDRCIVCGARIMKGQKVCAKCFAKKEGLNDLY